MTKKLAISGKARKFPAELYAKRLELAERLLIPQIAAGEVWARRNLLEIVADAVLNAGYFPPGVSSFVAEGLVNIAQDKGDLKSPFGVKRTKGQKRHFEISAGKQRDFSRAYRVECLVFDGMTVDEAIGAIAGEDGAPEDTIRGAWKRQHKSAKHEIDCQLKWCGQLMRI